MIQKLSGITCGNFGVRSKCGDVCYGAWHATCFYQHTKDMYPVIGVKNLDNSLVEEEYLIEDDMTRCMVAREGIIL